MQNNEVIFPTTRGLPYTLTVWFDGTIKEKSQLIYVGKAGDWLHFENLKTGKSHLCSPDHFPKHRMKSYDGHIEMIFE